jgi:para-aminobenzoate synthetase component 1
MPLTPNDWNTLALQSKEYPYQSFFLSSENSSIQPTNYHTIDWLFLAGNHPIETNIQQEFAQHPDWYFGHLAYDLKNEIHQLESKFTSANFPLQQWVRADWVVRKRKGKVEVLKGKPFQFLPQVELEHSPQSLKLAAAISKETYLKDLQRIQDYLHAGACYELNYCFPFLGKVCKDFNPWAFFQALSENSPMPFANFYQTPEFWSMGASPERYLQKMGNRVLSQPIKGTRRRSESSDEALKKELQKSEKENAEHIMIVDLMRNDLAKFCKPGSVSVPQLKEVYTFPRVHQMISSVLGELKEEENGLNLLFDAFPMGSMTGAPKRRVMEIIEEVEHFPRGLYSGTIGYLQPDGDFDFNVVIRTLVVERETGNAQMGVGGAITYLSQPDEEYEECWVKAAPILNLASNQGTS